MRHLTEDYLLSHHFIHFVSVIHQEVNVVDEKLVLESISSSLLAVYLCVLGSKAAAFQIKLTRLLPTAFLLTAANLAKVATSLHLRGRFLGVLQVLLV